MSVCCCDRDFLQRNKADPGVQCSGSKCGNAEMTITMKMSSRRPSCVVLLSLPALFPFIPANVKVTCLKIAKGPQRWVDSIITSYWTVEYCVNPWKLSDTVGALDSSSSSLQRVQFTLLGDFAMYESYSEGVYYYYYLFNLANIYSWFYDPMSGELKNLFRS